MQILPSGRVQIKNFETGETKEVAPEELGNYGGEYLVKQYQQARSLREESQPLIQTSTGSPSPIGGMNTPMPANPAIATGGSGSRFTYEQYQDALAQDMARGGKHQNALKNFYEQMNLKSGGAGTKLETDQKAVQDQYKNASSLAEQQEIAGAWEKANGYKLNATKPLDPAQKKELDRKELKDKTVVAAKAMLEVLNNKNKYASEKEYEVAKRSVVSRLSSSVGFGEGGKALTSQELAILAGYLINVEQPKTQTWWEKNVSGNVPVASGKALDDEETIRGKMNNIISFTATGKVPEPSGKKSAQPQSGNLLQNAGNDVKNLANGILGIPAGIANGSIPMGVVNPYAIGLNGDPIGETKKVADFLANGAKGIAGDINETLGRPLEGGDILGRIGKNAYEHPVNTALTVLPPAQMLKNARTASVAGKTAQVAKATEVAAGTAKGSEVINATSKTAKATNMAQDLTRNMTDFLSGGGSQKNIMQVTRKGEAAIPLNKTLMDDGVNLRPTETGKIQAATKAMDTHGKNLEKMYEKSSEMFEGDELSKALDAGLRDSWDQKSIDYIKTHINKQGSFDMASQDYKLTMKEGWNTAKKLEGNPPKSVGSPESAKAMKDLSNDAARIIRQNLGEKVKETLPENAHYSNYKDFFDNRITDNPQGMDVSTVGNIVTSPLKGLKSVANMGSNAAYKVAGKLGGSEERLLPAMPSNMAISQPSAAMVPGMLPAMPQGSMGQPSAAMIEELLQPSRKLIRDGRYKYFRASTSDKPSNARSIDEVLAAKKIEAAKKAEEAKRIAEAAKAAKKASTAKK